METPESPPTAARDLRAAYRRVRAATERLCEPLAVEDMVIQSRPEASPIRWHLAHTSWFFETFLLQPRLADYRTPNEAYATLFNSYYHTVGPQFSRPRRGLISRPTVAEVMDYRRHVDEAMQNPLSAPLPVTDGADLDHLVQVGLNHEQQHQELMLTDLKHLLSCNPLLPVYRESVSETGSEPRPLSWHDHPGGLVEVGHAGGGFAYDNEGPRHKAYLEPFRLASRPVTSGEYLEFMTAGGYEDPLLWLSEGWDAVQAGGWHAPLYWQQRDGAWSQFTLGGLRPVNPAEPVVHVSFFEADAYARWRGLRLPTEQEWETVAAPVTPGGNLADSERFHPAPPPAAGRAERGPYQLFGDVWEWTASPYRDYPGYRTPAGALGEYNAKFMSGQMVLRGGSCATPTGHIRATYRNFFAPGTRWQFSGFRLAQDGDPS